MWWSQQCPFFAFLCYSIYYLNIERDTSTLWRFSNRAFLLIVSFDLNGQYRSRWFLKSCWIRLSILREGHMVQPWTLGSSCSSSFSMSFVCLQFLCPTHLISLSPLLPFTVSLLLLWLLLAAREKSLNWSTWLSVQASSGHFTQPSLCQLVQQTWTNSIFYAVPVSPNAS